MPLLHMPLSIKWSAFNKNTVLAEPNFYGVYEIGDSNGRIRYIGEGRIKDRLNSHFVGGTHPIARSAKYRKETTGSKQRAKERERAELRAYARSNDGNWPPSNKRLG